jgi:hypothetical protein
MKFRFHTQAGVLLLSAAQLDKLLSLIADVEVIDDEWVGDGKGDNGGNCNKSVRPISIDKVSLTPIMEDTIEAYKLATKLRDAAKAK